MKTKIDLYVVDAVRKRRKEQGLTQADIAFELDISVGFIGKIESSKYSTHYNIKHLNELARILGCSPQDFLPTKPL